MNEIFLNIIVSKSNIKILHNKITLHIVSTIILLNEPLIYPQIKTMKHLYTSKPPGKSLGSS